MYNTRFKFRNNFVLLIVLICYSINFFACKESYTYNTDIQPEQTKVQFDNLEQYPITIYSDAARLNIVTQIDALSQKTLTSEPAPYGVAYYPTYIIDIPTISETNIPYNGQPIITVIEKNKTNKVFIPQMETIIINSAYLKIINNSVHSLSLRQSNTEKAPLGGKPTIIAPGQNASYTVSSGAVSGYSIMVNTIIPIGFPEVLQEFENGKVYIVTYDGTNLALTATWPIPSPAWPIASKNVRAEEISSTSIRISWDSICDADSYRVYRAIDNSANQYSLIATVNTPYHIDNYLQSSRSYFYKVSAIKDSKEGEQSNIFSFTNISPPQNFRAVGKGDTFILLSWSTELSAEIYCIYRSESSDGNYQKVNAPITHTWGTGYNNSYNYWYLWDTDINLKPLTTYYYKIYSVNQFGTESLKYSAITVPTVPNISFQVNHTSTNSITLGWNNLENATYDIYRSDNRNGVYNKISNNIVTNTYVDSNLIPNQTYWYYISVTFRVVEGVSSQTIQLSDRVVSATVEG